MCRTRIERKHCAAGVVTAMASLDGRVVVGDAEGNVAEFCAESAELLQMRMQAHTGSVSAVACAGEYVRVFDAMLRNLPCPVAAVTPGLHVPLAAHVLTPTRPIRELQVASAGGTGEVSLWHAVGGSLTLAKSAMLHTADSVTALVLAFCPGASGSSRQQPDLVPRDAYPIIVAAADRRLHVLRDGGDKALTSVATATMPSACTGLAFDSAGARVWLRPLTCISEGIVGPDRKIIAQTRAELHLTAQRLCAAQHADLTTSQHERADHDTPRARAGTAVVALHGEGHTVTALDLSDPLAPRVVATTHTSGKPLLTSAAAGGNLLVWCCEGSCQLVPQLLACSGPGTNSDQDADYAVPGVEAGGTPSSTRQVSSTQAEPLRPTAPQPAIGSEASNAAPRLPGARVGDPAESQPAEEPGDAFSWDSIKAVREQLEAMCASDAGDSASDAAHDVTPVPLSASRASAAPDALASGSGSAASSATPPDVTAELDQASAAAAAAATGSRTGQLDGDTARGCACSQSPSTSTQNASFISDAAIKAVQADLGGSYAAEEDESVARDQQPLAAVTEADSLTMLATPQNAAEDSSRREPLTECVADTEGASSELECGSADHDAARRRASDQACIDSDLRSSSAFVTLRTSSVRDASAAAGAADTAATPRHVQGCSYLSSARGDDGATPAAERDRGAREDNAKQQCAADVTCTL